MFTQSKRELRPHSRNVVASLAATSTYGGILCLMSQILCLTGAHSDRMLDIEINDWSSDFVNLRSGRNMSYV